MKTLFKIIIGLIIVLVLLVVGLNLFLNHGLKPAVTKALPKVSEAVGTDVEIGDISINLFGGTLNASDLRVGNPEGFDEPDLVSVRKTSLDVGLRALLGGVLEISDAAVKDAHFTLVRNQAGKINLSVLNENRPKPDATVPSESASPQTPATQAPPSPEQKDLPKIIVDQLAFDTLFDFIDHKTTNATPNRLGLKLALKVDDVSTFGTRTEDDWGSVTISGALRDNPDAFKTDIRSRVAPILDPLTASFTATGTIAAIDMRALGSIADEIGVTSSAVGIDLDLRVREGRYLPGSQFVALLRDAKLTGDLKKKNKNVELPPEISLTVPVSGTLASPIISMQQAITVSLVRNLTQNPDYLLDNVSVDGKSLRQRLNKALGGKQETDEDDKEVEKAVNDGLKKLEGLFK